MIRCMKILQKARFIFKTIYLQTVLEIIIQEMDLILRQENCLRFPSDCYGGMRTTGKRAYNGKLKCRK